VAEIGDFLRLAPLGGRMPQFDELRTLNPRFFRAGSDEANIAELAPYEDLFRSRHAEVMELLGYY
jgi:hypothetical protein